MQASQPASLTAYFRHSRAMQTTLISVTEPKACPVWISTGPQHSCSLLQGCHILGSVMSKQTKKAFSFSWTAATIDSKFQFFPLKWQLYSQCVIKHLYGCFAEILHGHVINVIIISCPMSPPPPYMVLFQSFCIHTMKHIEPIRTKTL
jgi:hypothetical protein